MSVKPISLADMEAVLTRLVRWARVHGGDIHYSGDHPIAAADALLAQYKSETATKDTPLSEGKMDLPTRPL